MYVCINKPPKTLLIIVSYPILGISETNQMDQPINIAIQFNSIHHHNHLNHGTTAPLPATAFSPNLSTYHFRPQRACGSMFATALAQNTTAGSGSGTRSRSAAHAAGTSHGARRLMGGVAVAYEPEPEVESLRPGNTAVPASAKPNHSSHSKT